MSTHFEGVPQLGNFFSFPDPVNEVSARLVAGAVLIMSAVAIALDQRWLPFVIFYGFVARVLSGPKLSPLGQVVTRFVTPRLPLAPRLVSGPPKRFAQGIGVAVTGSAAVLTGLGYWTAAEVALGLIIIAATLESVFGYCLGCKAFGLLMRSGVIPKDVCERCSDIGSRHRDASTPTDYSVLSKPDSSHSVYEVRLGPAGEATWCGDR